MRKALLLALSLVGLFDSVYLWWVYTSSSRPLVCIGGGCDAVRVSPFAHAWGIPLPAFGAAMYAVLVLLVFAQPLVASRLASRMQLAVAVISGAGFLTSLYLTSIEAFVLHAWCGWCVVSAIAVTLILVLSVLEIVRPEPPPEPGVSQPATLRTNVALLVVAVVVSVPAFVWLAHHGEPPPLVEAPHEPLSERLERPDSHVTGNPDAAVAVVEFGDFECPVCGAEEQTVRELRQKYGTRIRFVFRQFPLTSLHPYAEQAAEASECAAEQGKFWEAVDKLYAEQNDLSEPALMRDAADLGLDQARFGQCLQSHAEAGRVRRDMEDGRALHVDRTPMFFVGERVVAGQIPLDQFAQLIDQELQRHRTSAQSADGPKPAEDPAVLLGASPGNVFANLPPAGIACSEAEAKKKQPTLIHTEEARRLFADASGTLFVDVRSPKDFQSSRIPRAINIPVEEMPQHWASLPRDKTIVFYEGGRSAGDVCASGRAAGRILLEHGFSPEHVRVYQEGLLSWEKTRLPLAR